MAGPPRSARIPSEALRRRSVASCPRVRAKGSHAMAGRSVSKDVRSRSGPALPPFERVVDEHGLALLRFCVARVGPERADDCFQETMLAALRAYGEVREAGAVRSWLFAIAARKAIDGHRARARA